MTATELTALLALCTAVSFTPGPNTMLSTALAANHGLRTALRFCLAVPAGWFLPVTPGTRYATVGGALSQNSAFFGSAAHGTVADAERYARYDVTTERSVQSTVRIRRWLIAEAQRLAVAFTDPMQLYLTEDFRESVAAHVEKRAARPFKGR